MSGGQVKIELPSDNWAINQKLETIAGVRRPALTSRYGSGNGLYLVEVRAKNRP